MTKLNELTTNQSLLDSDYLLSESLGVNFKETRQQQDLYFKAKNDLRYAPIKNSAGSWVMNNGVWVPGYSKQEIDDLNNGKFHYETVSVNTDPTTLSDGAYKWTWNAGNTGMPFDNDGEYQAACIVINGTRRLVLRKNNISKAYEYQNAQWFQIAIEREPIIITPRAVSEGVFGATPVNVVITEIPEDNRVYTCLLYIMYTGGISGNIVYARSDIMSNIKIGSISDNENPRPIRTKNRTITLTGSGNSSAHTTVMLHSVY